MKMIKDENLVLLNALDLCDGVITRVDPRDGKGTTIDLAVCNQVLAAKIIEMKIDEEEIYRPTNYATVIKKTDHSTIMVKAIIDRCPAKKGSPYLNTKD